MYQTKHVYYKTIFKQDGQSETIEYKAQGVLSKGQETHLSFSIQDDTIHIFYDQESVTLNHGHSTLKFDFQGEIWNQYELPYGTVPLKTKLLLFEANDDRIKMKYELYDHQGLLLTAYVLITLIPLSNQEDI